MRRVVKIPNSLFLILRITLNGCKIILQISIVIGVIYCFYKIGGYQKITIIKSLKKFKKRFFNDLKNKKKIKLPFKIEESLEDNMPIKIIIDDENFYYRRIKKYGSIILYLSSCIIKKFNRDPPILENDLDKLKEDIIQECIKNKWFK